MARLNGERVRTPAIPVTVRPVTVGPTRRMRATAALIVLHRWLGIAGCLLFLAWFASGIVMMYARMPALTTDERLARAERLDLASARFAPAEAAVRAGMVEARAGTAGADVGPGAGADVEVATIGMLEGRPIYRYAASTVRGSAARARPTGPGTVTLFADTAERFAGFTETSALREARRIVPEHAATLRYDALIAEPDQWTLQSRAHLPLHRIALGDDADTRLYLSNITGEPVMKTTARARFWAYWGPVTHWLYLPVLRRNGPLWTQVIIWSSAVGCVMCLSGLLVGLIRYSPWGRYRLRGGTSRSPYVGLMKWHHYAGLIFGLITFTWTFSGLLSMGPFSWLSDGGPPGMSRARTQPSTALTLTGLRAAVAGVEQAFAPKELTLTTFRGESYWLALRAPDRSKSADGRWNGLRPRTGPPLEHRLIPTRRPEYGTFTRFDDDAMMAAAREAMPGMAVRDAMWLHGYDAYYYDRHGARPLPVLRVRYDDPRHTWLYLDPHRGTVALRTGTRGRLNRWLYHGLHSLDFPFLYDRRPLWDIIVIALSLGGIALGATTLTPAWTRLRRHVRRGVQSARVSE